MILEYVDQGGVVKAQWCSDLNTIDAEAMIRDDRIIANGGRLDELTEASHKASQWRLATTASQRRKQQRVMKTINGRD